MADRQGIGQAYFRFDETASADSISANQWRVDFQCHHQTICQSPWPDGDNRRNDCSQRNGLSVCSFALDRACRTFNAVKTGNLTNAVLGLVELSSRTQPLTQIDRRRIRGALHLLVGFFVGCVAAAVAVMYLGDWAWSFPTVLAALVVMLSEGKSHLLDNSGVVVKPCAPAA